MPTKIKVCDAIMGSGKTQGCMTYIREHPEKRFLYITPYLPEVERMIAGCPEAHFVQPSDRLKTFSFSKTKHCLQLLKEGRNIASTHQLFRQYPEEALSYIRDNHYIIIIDEAVATFTDAELRKSDLEVIRRAQYIEKTENGYKLVDDDYEGGKLSDLFSMLRHNQLVEFDYKEKTRFYYWMLPRDVLAAFDEVIVLTYMFECQDICYYLQINGMEWSYIGVEKEADGTFRLTDGPGYVPEYVQHLGDMIHIFDKPSLNKIGAHKTAFSENWLKSSSEHSEKAQKALYCYFNNYFRGTDKSRRMWGTYKSLQGKLQGQGYTRSYLVFNAKACNEYRNRDILAYCSNIYMRPEKKHWFADRGVNVQEDRYALSVMLQWIWRSAIRDGKEIWIYIPSARMRKLLEDWIEEVSALASVA